MTFPAYPDYRDTDVDWLGQLPNHWRDAQVRRVFRIHNGATPTSGYDEYWGGGIPWVTPDDLGRLKSQKIAASQRTLTESGYRSCGTALVPPGSLIVSTRAPVGYVAITSVNACTNQGCRSLVPNLSLDSRFYAYHIRACAEFLQAISGGSTFQELSSSSLASFRLSLPPIDEQQAIADFLDHEIARIDALIEEQQRLIALFAEKRTALISHAIRDHGTDRETKLGHYAEVLQGYAFPSNQFQQDSGMRLLRGINIGVNGLRWNDLAYWPDESAAEYRRFFLRKDDIVFGMDRPWINGGTRVAWVTEHDLPALLLQRVARIRPRRGLTRRFLFLILSSSEFRESIESDLTGVSVPHISPDQIANFRLQLPDEMSQARICDAVDRELARLDATTDEATGLIERLHERRSALIAAAVSGKIDVRQWHQANAPEIACESLSYRSSDQLA